ncbi:MAG TPA: hypothetical protein VGE86_09325 [Thermoanaerobaculia bacterium]
MTKDAAVERERQRCAAICRRRAELWRRTSERPDAPAMLRDEARARANEAAYLADLLASGADLAAEADEPPDA